MTVGGFHLQRTMCLRHSGTGMDRFAYALGATRYLLDGANAVCLGCKSGEPARSVIEPTNP